jgi:hypothetical protein
VMCGRPTRTPLWQAGEATTPGLVRRFALGFGLPRLDHDLVLACAAIADQLGDAVSKRRRVSAKAYR